MRSHLLAASLLVACAVPASAQIYSVESRYCGGDLVAQRFETRVTPGAQGRTEYFATFANGRPARIAFQIQVVGDMLGKPTGQAILNGRETRVFALGYTLPGRIPLRNEQLANAVRVSCQ